MKRLPFLFTLLALTFVTGSVFAQFTKSQMVEEWQRAKAYTKEYLDAMPADGYGLKPKPEMRSFAQQMLHLADANYFFASKGSDKPSPLGQNNAEKTVPQTKEATTRAVMESYDFVISALESLTPEQAEQTIKFANKDLTRIGIFGKAFEHQTHHRGQTTVYLRLQGVTPPAEKLF